MLLTLKERLTLMGVLPPQGDFTTIKILRQFKESLAPDEEENKLFRYEFQCPQCGAKEAFPSLVKCAKCDVLMEKTGQVLCINWEIERDIPISDICMQITKDTLKKMESTAKDWVGNPNPPLGIKMLKEEHISLYEKFIG